MSLGIFVVIALFACCRSAVHVPDAGASNIIDFHEFMQRHERKYAVDSPEYLERKALFERSLERVRRQNAKLGRSWSAGINHLSDRSDEEYRALLSWKRASHGGKGLRPGAAQVASSDSSVLEVAASSYPTVVDWRHLNTASHFVDQGGCGSCWAVASADLLASHYELKHNETRSFAVQELVDCVSNPWSCGGQGGCQGATVELGMDWALHRGLETDERRPYEARNRQCQKAPFRRKKENYGQPDADGRILHLPEIAEAADSLASAVDLSGHAFGLCGFTTLATNKYRELMEAALEGPVAVSVAAGSWSLYAGGIFDESAWEINHAVVLYGYGEEVGAGADANLLRIVESFLNSPEKGSVVQKYWIIKNSWGGLWGESGFIRLKRSDDDANNCGWDMRPLEGVSCESSQTPQQTWVCGQNGILYDSVSPKFVKTGSPCAAEAPRAAVVRREQRPFVRAA